MLREWPALKCHAHPVSYDIRKVSPRTPSPCNARNSLIYNFQNEIFAESSATNIALGKCCRLFCDRENFTANANSFLNITVDELVS